MQQDRQLNFKIQPSNLPNMKMYSQSIFGWLKDYNIARTVPQYRNLYPKKVRNIFVDISITMHDSIYYPINNVMR